VKFVRLVVAVVTPLAVLALLYVALIRPWHTHWGATREEIASALPGDSLVANPVDFTTRAITIKAWPRHVWPWLAQMGRGRGGLYSYDALDRAFGILDAPSADSLIPGFQKLAAGDTIPVGGSRGWPVAIARPNEVLLIHVQEQGVHVTWAFALRPVSRTETRLIMRVRAELPHTWSTPFIMAALDPAEFVMMQRQFLGIRARAERLALADPAYVRARRRSHP
jgi:hypothetical protein